MTGQVRRSTDPGLPSPGPAAAAGRPTTRPSAAETAETRLMAEIEAALLGDLPTAPAATRREPSPPSAAADRPPADRPPVRLWPRTDDAAHESPAAAPRQPAGTAAGAAPVPQAPAAGRVAADRLRADRLPADAGTRFDDAPAAADTSSTDTPAAADDPWPAEGRWSRSAKAGRRDRRRGGAAIAAAAFLVLAAAAGGALLLALPDADSPAPDGSPAAGSAGPGRESAAAGADGDAASDSPRTVATVRVVEAPSTPPGGAPAQAETTSGTGAAPATPSPAAVEPDAPAIGTTALRGSTDASTDDGAAGQDPADASVATAPAAGAAENKIVTRIERGDAGGVRLEEALIAAAAARARLAGTQPPADAADAAGQPEGSTGAADASAASAAAAGEPAATGAAGAATGSAMPIDPGGFGVVPLRAPREAGGNAASAGEADAPVRTAAADPTEPAPRAEATAAAQAEAPVANDAGAAPSAGAGRAGRIVSAVNMRAAPDNDAATIKVIPAGTAVQVVSCDYWCEVDFGGTRGWVYKRFVDAAAAAAP